MFSFKKVLIRSLLLILAIFILSSCQDNNGKDTGGDGGDVVDGGAQDGAKQLNVVSTVKYVTEAEYVSGQYDVDLKDSAEIAVGEKIYAVIDYTFTGKKQIVETDTVNISVNAVGEADAQFTFSVEELPTPDRTINDKSVYANLSLQINGKESKSFRFIVAVTSESVGNIKISTEISSDLISFFGDAKKESSITVSEALLIDSKLEFTLSDDQTYYILTGLGEETGDSIIVPSKYKGIPVKEIADNVFMNVTYLKTVKLYEGLEKIGASAFEGCTSLKYVTIPLSVTHMGRYAFANCPSLEMLCVAFGPGEEWNETWIYAESFVTWGYRDEMFILNPDGVSYSFIYGSYGRNVIIPESYKGLPVTAIAESAFQYCIELQRIKIPSR